MDTCEGGLAWGRYVAVFVGLSERWQVTRDSRHLTCDTWNMTCDTWHVTFDTWRVTIFFFFLSTYVRFGIGATIRTRREIQCLPFAGFSSNRPTGPIRSSFIALLVGKWRSCKIVESKWVNFVLWWMLPITDLEVIGEIHSHCQNRAQCLHYNILWQIVTCYTICL